MDKSTGRRLMCYDDNMTQKYFYIAYIIYIGNSFKKILIGSMVNYLDECVMVGVKKNIVI